jgi:hypothetical protein
LSLADFQLEVESWIQDTAGKLTPAAKNLAIAAAIDTYSRHRPRQKVTVLTGAGQDFDFAVPADWVDGVSSVLAVENPVDLQRPEFLDDNEIRIRYDPITGLPRFRFFTEVLESGEKAYVTYGVPHVVTASSDSIPLADRLAVVKLAASGCATQLAALYAQTSDPTYGADTVNYRTKSQDYLALAKALKLDYQEHIGAALGVAAASVSSDLDVVLQNFAGPPFFHSNLDR